MLCLTGCGETGRVEVQGRVTFQGTPLKTGSVTFASTGEDGAVAASLIDSEGRYRLRESQDVVGIWPGTYDVAIRSLDEGQDLAAPPDPDYVSPIPLKYAATKTSGLTVTVDETTSTIDFDLRPE